jgi:HK97 family phage major capsid protein
MTIEQLRAAVDAAENAFQEARTAYQAEQTRVAEASAEDDLVALRTAFDASGTALEDAATELERCKSNLADGERRQKLIDDNPATARAAAGTLRTVEPPVYGPESGESRSFFEDAYRMAEMHDSTAGERLERHGRHNLEQMRAKGVQLRDVGTGAFAGLTVPVYLIDMFAPLARAGAPTLNMIARKLPLPEKGMTLNISRATTGTAVAAQASENTGVQETDFDDTLLTINVNTYAGQQDVSRQALERSEMVDAVIYQDLVAAYFTTVNAAIINGAGTSGTHLGIRSVSGINAVTYTDASPTVPELYPKGADAVQRINANVFAPATGWVMHPSRWGWMEAALDSSNRPLIVPDATTAFNPIAVGDAAAYGQVVGKWHGLPVVTDGNILTTIGAGTNQDTILAVSGYNLLFWQENDGMPRQLKFEQSNAPQSIRLAVFSYSAFSAGRYPAASSTIDGTGLTAATF